MSEPTTALAVADIQDALGAPWTDEESQIFDELIFSDKSIEELIPTDMEPSRLWKGFKTAAKGWKENQRSAVRLKLALGRYLLIIQQNPTLYTNYGYRNWNDFMSNGVPQIMGVSRPEAFGTLKIARILPEVGADVVDDLGMGKLGIVATAVQRSVPKDAAIEMRQEVANRWVADARTMTIDQLKEKMETEQLIEKGELDRVALVISVRPETKKDFEEMAADTRIHAVIGTTDPDQMLFLMMASCRGEWSAQAEDLVRAS